MGAWVGTGDRAWVAGARYLAAHGWLDELGDGHLALLQPPLHQLGAADVDGAEHVPTAVLHERAAVDDQRSPRSTPQQAGQLPGIHHLPREPVPGHGGAVGSGEGVSPEVNRGCSAGQGCGLEFGGTGHGARPAGRSRGSAGLQAPRGAPGQLPRQGQPPKGPWWDPRAPEWLSLAGTHGGPFSLGANRQPLWLYESQVPRHLR